MRRKPRQTAHIVISSVVIPSDAGFLYLRLAGMESLFTSTLCSGHHLHARFVLLAIASTLVSFSHFASPSGLDLQLDKTWTRLTTPPYNQIANPDLSTCLLQPFPSPR